MFCKEEEERSSKVLVSWLIDVRVCRSVTVKVGCCGGVFCGRRDRSARGENEGKISEVRENRGKSSDVSQGF